MGAHFTAESIILILTFFALATLLAMEPRLLALEARLMPVEVREDAKVPRKRRRKKRS
jgi:hypothetical protein